MHQQNEHLLTSDSLQNNCLFVAPKLIFHAAQRTRCLTLLLFMPQCLTHQQFKSVFILVVVFKKIYGILHSIKVTVELGKG